MYDRYQQCNEHVTFTEEMYTLLLWLQFFEVNIRILGGLLSAYYLSGGDELYKQKALQLADRLLPVFNTSSGIANTHVQLRLPNGGAPGYQADGSTNIAEAGTLSLEFTSLGRITG